MPLVNRTKGFMPQNGYQELSYHLEGSTIYGLAMTPKSTNQVDATWYDVDQSTGMFLNTRAAVSTVLSEVGFKNSFTYYGYIPNYTDWLLMEIGGRHFPIKSVSRTIGGYTPDINSIRIEPSNRTKLFSNGDQSVYRVRLRSDQPGKIDPKYIGARMQRVTGQDSIPYAILRSFHHDPDDFRNVTLVFEGGQGDPDALMTSGTEIFRVLVRSYSCDVVLDDYNPFFDFDGEVKDYTSSQPKLVSCSPFDKGWAIRCNGDAKRMAWIASDKLNFPHKPKAYQTTRPAVPTLPYWNEAVKSNDMSGNVFNVWYDGCWNIASVYGNDNIKIYPADDIEAAEFIEYLEGIAHVNQNTSGANGYGYIESHHTGIPGITEWINDGPISFHCFEEEVPQVAIEFPNNSYVRFGNASKSIFLSDANTYNRVIKLDSLPTQGYLCDSDKPGVQVDSRKPSTYFYLTDAIEKPGIKSANDSKVLLDFKQTKANWGNMLSSSFPWQGAIFAKSLTQQTTGDWTMSSCAKTSASGQWRGALEYYNGPIFSFGGGHIDQQTIMDFDPGQFFDFRASTGILSGSAWSVRDSFTSSLFSKDDDFVVNEKIHDGKWIVSPVYLPAWMKTLYNSEDYEAFVLFGRSLGAVSWTANDSFWTANRINFAFNAYDTEDLDYSTGNHALHLFSVGEPVITTSTTTKLNDGWDEGARSMWWDGDSWHLRCLGGGDPEAFDWDWTDPFNPVPGDPRGDTYKSNWGMESLNVYNHSAVTFRSAGDEWSTVTINTSSGTTSNYNETYQYTSGMMQIGGDSSVVDDNIVWKDEPDPWDNNIATPYIPHIGELEIQIDGEGSYIRLYKSCYQSQNNHIHLGGQIVQFSDLNPADTSTATTDMNNIHGHFWRVRRPNSNYAIYLYKPRQFEFVWDWESDIDLKDGRRVRLGMLPLDGQYHHDIYVGPQDYEKLNQRERYDKYGTTGKSQLDSLFGAIYDMQEMSVLSTPRFTEWSTWHDHQDRNEGNFDNYQITGNYSDCPTLLSNGRASLINARTERSFDLRLNSAKPQYSGGITARNESISGVSRAFDLQVTNNGANSVYIDSGNAKLYVVDGVNRVLVAQNNQQLSAFPTGNAVSWTLATPVNPIPSYYGAKRLELEILTTTDKAKTLVLDGIDGLQILRHPSLRCENDSVDYAFVVDSDSQGQIRGVETYPGTLMTSGKKQERYTRNHTCSWYIKAVHEGDNEYAMLENIVLANSYLKFYNPASPGSYTQNSLSSAPDGTDIAHGEEAGFITSNIQINNAAYTRVQLTIQGYATGVLVNIDVTGETEAGVNISHTHDIQIEEPPVVTNDDGRFVLRNASLSMQEDNDNIFLQDNSNVTLNGYFLKDPGTAQVRGMQGWMQWEPYLDDGNSTPPNHWFGDVTLDFGSSNDEDYFSTSPNWTPHIGTVPNKLQDYNLKWYPHAGYNEWRDQNMAPFVNWTGIQVNPKPVRFYGAAIVNITNITQTEDGRIRVVANYSTGVDNNCRIRVHVNGKPALITSAASTTAGGDSIVYGYADPTVIEQQGGGWQSEIWRAPADTSVSEANSEFGVDNSGTKWNPAFRDSLGSDWHWTNVISETGVTHEITFEIDAKHWAYHGGLTNTYSAFDDGSTSYSTRQYTNGLKEYQGPIRIKVEVEQTQSPVGISHDEKNYNFSYKRPLLGSFPAATQDYESYAASFKVPSTTVYAPENGGGTKELFYGDMPVNGSSGWTSSSTVFNTTVNYSISTALRNTWAGLYLKLLDGYGNSNFAFYIRPHDINADTSANIPETNLGPVAVWDDINRTNLLVNSGSNMIFAANSLTEDIAVKDWDLVARITQGVGASTDYFIDPSASWNPKHTVLSGRWAFDWDRVNNASYAPWWNFQNSSHQRNNLDPDPTTDGWVTRDSYEYEGWVTGKNSGYIYLNNGLVVGYLHGGTVYCDTNDSVITLNDIQIGDRVGFEGWFTSDSVIYANVVRKLTRLDGFRDWGQSTEFDSELQQDVLVSETWGWNTVLRKDRVFYLKNSGTRYDTFFITYKLDPMFASHPSRRRSTDRRIRAFVECDTGLSCYAKQFSMIDDGTWHTAIVRDVANVSDAIQQLRIRIYGDNREEEYTEPIRELESGETVSHGSRIRVANAGFLRQNFEQQPGHAHLFLNKYTLPITVDGDDKIQLGIRVSDYAGHTVTTMNSTNYYVRPKDPSNVQISHADTTDGTLRGRLVDFDRGVGESTEVEYQIGYADNYNLDNPVYLASGAWLTYTQWTAGSYLTNALEEGQTYYFFVIARNPHSSPPVYNASWSNPDRSEFTTGYITPIITDSYHLCKAIHNWNTGNNLDGEVREWEQGARQKSRASNPNQTDEGYHFRSRWYDGAGNWMPNIERHSREHNPQVRIWDVRSSFPVDGWFYSVTYGPATKLSQPTTSDSEMTLVSGSDLYVAPSLTASYRGYAYIHIRPYYTNGVGTKILFPEKNTVHIALYLDYQDNINPSAGEIYSLEADGVDNGSGTRHTYSTEPDWNAAIYRLKAITQGAQGIKDSSGIYIEDEEGIRWQMFYKVPGGSPVAGPISPTPWTYNSSQVNGAIAPYVATLQENTKYEIAIRAYSEAGTFGQLTDYDNDAYTNARPVDTITSMTRGDGTITIRFTGIGNEDNELGKYEIWNYSKNIPVDTADYENPGGIYDVEISVSPGDLSSYIVKSYNGDGLTLSDYPFRRHRDTSASYTWRPEPYTFMQDLVAPTATVGVGYKSTGIGRYFRVRPSLEIAEDKEWYNGLLLSADNNTSNFEDIVNTLYYCCAVEDENGFLGYIDLNNPGYLTGDINSAWFNLSTWLSTQDAFSDFVDLNIKYGFSFKAKKSTDILETGTDGTELTHQYDVCNNPQGDQVLYSPWGQTLWTYPYPKAEDDYETNLHMFTKWKWSDEPDLPYTQTVVSQDIGEFFEALKDFRISFKVLASETSNIFALPSVVQDLDWYDAPNAIVPNNSVQLQAIAKTASGEYVKTVVLWANANLGNPGDAVKIRELNEYDGQWGGYGILNQTEGSVSDNFAQFTPSATGPMTMDEWYHVRMNLYEGLKSEIGNGGETWDDVTKVRIKLMVGASRGFIYDPSRYTPGVNWGDESWKEYDESQIGVLFRNAAIGWTAQIDSLGRTLYDEKSWNGEYFWSVANFALKYNKAYDTYLTGLESGSQPVSTSKPNKFIEKSGAWSTAIPWIYDSYVKNLMSDVKGDNNVYDFFSTS